MLVVGLAGPMGAGKSLVLDLLSRRGAVGLRADDASRELLAPPSRLTPRIAAELGERVLSEDRSLNRARTAALIFHDAAARRRLEAILHPPMVEWLRERLQELRQGPRPPAVAVVEAAILTHMGARPLVDLLVRVHAPPGVCVRRLQERDGLSAAEAEERVATHQALGLFEEPADFVLDTSGSLADTARQVAQLWEDLVGLAAGVAGAA